MTNEMIIKRNQLADKHVADVWGENDIGYGRLATEVDFKKGFDACFDLMSAKIERLEKLWRSHQEQWIGVRGERDRWMYHAIKLADVLKIHHKMPHYSEILAEHKALLSGSGGE